MVDLMMVADAVGTPWLGFGVAVAFGRAAWWLASDYLFDRIDLPPR